MWEFPASITQASILNQKVQVVTAWNTSGTPTLGARSTVNQHTETDAKD
jgi:hypothetical protein